MKSVFQGRSSVIAILKIIMIVMIAMIISTTSGLSASVRPTTTTSTTTSTATTNTRTTIPQRRSYAHSTTTSTTKITGTIPLPLPPQSLSNNSNNNELPSWMSLPKSSSSSAYNEVDNVVLYNMELWIGRLAMIGAVSVIGKELLTGESLPQQFIDFFNSIHITM